MVHFETAYQMNLILLIILVGCVLHMSVLPFQDKDLDNIEGAWW